MVEGHPKTVANPVGKRAAQVLTNLARRSRIEALKKGLSCGADPLSLSRRITPVKCASSGSGPPN
jgi:hypothetical protein